MTDWETEAKLLFKAELARKGMGYAELAKRLGEMGVEDTPGSIANKVSRGRFSLVFFMQCMKAIEVEQIRLSNPRIKPLP